MLNCCSDTRWYLPVAFSASKGSIHLTGKVKFLKRTNTSLQIRMGTYRHLDLALLSVHELVSHLTFRSYTLKKLRSDDCHYPWKYNELVKAMKLGRYVCWGVVWLLVKLDKLTLLEARNLSFPTTGAAVCFSKDDLTLPQTLNSFSFSHPWKTDQGSVLRLKVSRERPQKGTAELSLYPAWRSAQCILARRMDRTGC